MARDDVLIVGAGIGGLTVALCLHRLGFDVKVYEQTEQTASHGAGIQLSPNATRVLHEIGLADPLASIASEPGVIELRHWRTGERVTTAQLSPAKDTYCSSFPYYHVHRRDLIACLTQAANNASIPVYRGKRIDDVGVNGTYAWISGPTTRERASFIVGADGIHSRVRRCLFGSNTTSFSGHVAWRGVISTATIDTKALSTKAGLWWGPKKHVVHYPVRRGQYINVVCVERTSQWNNESWNERGDQTKLIAAFNDWHQDVTQLIEKIDPDACYRWGLFNHAPLKQWSQGRATLLGDACHPTLPYLAQGAAMAIEDGAVLAQCVSKSSSAEDGLATYEKIRRKRTARIQKLSRRNGHIFHLIGPAAWARDMLASRAGERLLHRIHQYDVFTSLNKHFKE